MSTIDRKSIAEAARRISPYIRLTPTMKIRLPDRSEAALKLECLQHAGSFKARGAFNNLLTRDIPPAGVVAASGGNHGAAIAYAARELEVPAQIYVPTISSPAKLALIRELGARVVVDGDAYAQALDASIAYQRQSGASSVHAYDSPETIIGQATLGYELARQCPDIDTLLVAVGGGGLIGGIAAWYQGDVKVVAVEPNDSCAYHQARACGQPVDVEVAGVAADSLGARRCGKLMFAIGQRWIADSVLINDTAISAAQRWAWRELRLAVEPGGAAALAALLDGVYAPARGERVGVVMCGANVDLATLASQR